VVARVVANPRRGCQQGRVVAFGGAALLGERRPEAELVAELRRVAPVEERLEKERGLRVLLRLTILQAERERVPAGLARHGLEDVRIDLGQSVVARHAAKR